MTHGELPLSGRRRVATAYTILREPLRRNHSGVCFHWPRRSSAPGIVKTFVVCSDAAMSQSSNRPTLYKGYRFPPEVISQCVWLYYRFGVSLRDVSELMLARGIEVSHEAIRLWTLRFGIEYAD